MEDIEPVAINGSKILADKLTSASIEDQEQIIEFQSNRFKTRVVRETNKICILEIQDKY